jgi:capsular exopolysaccharide synthesis family protein
MTSPTAERLYREPAIETVAVARDYAAAELLTPAHARRRLPGPETAPPAEPAAAPDSRLLPSSGAYDHRGETVRALRTELLLRHEAVQQANAVALLSPSAGEGRSQLAAELAISFAQLGRRTLLIDADMRRAGQHILFGVKNNSGLAQALTQDETPPLHAVAGLPTLHLLTAGRCNTNPLELLSQSRFEALVAQWREDFDCVVFDTPPLSASADALAVATIIGRVLVLSRANHTSFKSLHEMLRRLVATRAQVVGAVINHF